MTDPLTVLPGERGVVRIFALTIEAGGIKAFRAPGAIDTALGVQNVVTEYVEVFPITDLAGVGLAAYLVDGCGVPETVVEPERERLDAIEGHVMVVLSRAFDGNPAQIQPAGQLRLIGTFSETPVDWSGNGPIETQSARPGSGTATAPRKTRARARIVGASIFAVFILLICLIVLLIAL